MKSFLLASFLGALFSLSATAAPATDDGIITNLEQKLGVKVSSIADSPVPGLFEIITDRGLFYVSENGEYFMQARLYSVKDDVTDLTENSLKKMRLAGVDKFADSAIVFKSKKEKHVINVFTDTTCGYCRKLHGEMSQLNDLGITVRYLAFPRAGLNSDVYTDTVSVWCATNPQQAMTKAKAGESVITSACENSVAEQYKFGQSIGVNGTPNIILPDGSVLPGYKPASDIAELIKLSS